MTVLDTFDLAGCDDAELARRAQTGDVKARRVLIERYLPLSRRLALRYRQSGEPLDDLIQVASVGLVRTVDRWDPTMGYAFATYAVPSILGELRRYFRDATWMVRPPRGLLELSLVVERVREQRRAVLGREPTVAELSVILGRPAAAVTAALEAHAARVATSLDTPVQDGEQEATLTDVLGDDDDAYARAEARATIAGLTPILDERARRVLRMRFQHDLIQREIAAALGCSQMQVSRLISAALERLSAHVAMGCGEWAAMTTEGATA